jgi:hypothetical protein
MIVALAAVVVAMFATAAYAATAVYGTNGNDQPLNESSGFADDRIYALGGNDYINAVLTWGTPDTDKLMAARETMTSPLMTGIPRICSTVGRATTGAGAARASASLIARRCTLPTFSSSSTEPSEMGPLWGASERTGLASPVLPFRPCSRQCVEGRFCELRLYGVLRSCDKNSPRIHRCLLRSRRWLI